MDFKVIYCGTTLVWDAYESVIELNLQNENKHGAYFSLTGLGDTPHAAKKEALQILKVFLEHTQKLLDEEESKLEIKHGF